ncbi:MAG TPA: M56 family metallopeptidase [Candidatus Eisenbacteria bacterium]|nr:M56 family metallopeptidase [Candidatus Eisenbacteria bacterium]
MNLDLFRQAPTAAFDWTWQTSLHATVLIALVFATLIASRQWLTPAWRYGLWLLIVLRLVLPVAPASPFSVFNLTALTINPVPLKRPVEVTPMLAPVQPTAERAYVQTPVLQPAPASASSGLLGFLKRLNPRSLAGWFWLVGVAIFLLSTLRRHANLSSRLRRGNLITEDRVQLLLASCQRTIRVRRKIQVIETEHVSTPAVFGFFRPRLLLPAPVWRSLDKRELRLVFLHELTHVQHGDILLNWLFILLQAVHWFNPLVWLALKRLRAERELVRDGQVLSRLDSAERKCYGNTLIKLAEQFTPARLSPSLAPVLNHQTEIKRRIIMITQFKPTPRLVTIASAALVVALGCFTFTRAAEKEPPPQSKETAGPAPESKKEMQKRGIEVLKQEWAKKNALVLEKQKEVDALKEKLNISPFDEALYSASGDFDPATLRKYESMRVEALANYNQLNTLYTHLRALSRSDLRKAVLTASPDQHLNSLMDHLAESEVRLEGLESDNAKAHPDVIKMLRIVKK